VGNKQTSFLFKAPGWDVACSTPVGPSQGNWAGPLARSPVIQVKAPLSRMHPTQHGGTSLCFLFARPGPAHVRACLLVACSKQGIRQKRAASQLRNPSPSRGRSLAPFLLACFLAFRLRLTSLYKRRL
jgi:hypothetical protein